MCQKAHGAAYATYVNVDLNGLHIIEGQEYLTHYESSPGVVRTFCKKCGSNLQFMREGKDRIGVAAGIFDTSIGSSVDYEIWTSSAPDWGARDEIPLSHDTKPSKREAN